MLAHLGGIIFAPMTRSHGLFTTRETRRPRAPQTVLVGVMTLLLAGSVLATQDRRLTRAETDGRRVALVMGNDAYATAPLRNARNDARAVGAALEELGFTVTLVLDATRSQMGAAVERFSRGLSGNDVAAFSYAGRGM
jgi:hypothetical protein